MKMPQHRRRRCWLVFFLVLFCSTSLCPSAVFCRFVWSTYNMCTLCFVCDVRRAYVYIDSPTRCAAHVAGGRWEHRERRRDTENRECRASRRHRGRRPLQKETRFAVEGGGYCGAMKYRRAPNSTTTTNPAAPPPTRAWITVHIARFSLVCVHDCLCGTSGLDGRLIR